MRIFIEIPGFTYVDDLDGTLPIEFGVNVPDGAIPSAGDTLILAGKFGFPDVVRGPEGVQVTRVRWRFSRGSLVPYIVVALPQTGETLL